MALGDIIKIGNRKFQQVSNDYYVYMRVNEKGSFVLEKKAIRLDVPKNVYPDVFYKLDRGDVYYSDALTGLQLFMDMFRTNKEFNENKEKAKNYFIDRLSKLKANNDIENVLLSSMKKSGLSPRYKEVKGSATKPAPVRKATTKALVRKAPTKKAPVSKTTTKVSVRKGVTINNGVSKSKGYFEKIHTSKQALDSHVRRIRLRGGSYKTQKVAKGYYIKYKF